DSRSAMTCLRVGGVDVADHDLPDARPHEGLHLLVHRRDLVALMVFLVVEGRDDRPAVGAGPRGEVGAEVIVADVGQLGAHARGVRLDAREEFRVRVREAHQDCVIEHSTSPPGDWGPARAAVSTPALASQARTGLANAGGMEGYCKMNE